MVFKKWPTAFTFKTIDCDIATCGFHPWTIYCDDFKLCLFACSPCFASTQTAFGTLACAISICTGTDPGEVKWVNFHPLVLSPLLFFYYPSNIEIIVDLSDILTKGHPHFKFIVPPLLRFVNLKFLNNFRDFPRLKSSYTTCK